jgi:hypothetical protein
LERDDFAAACRHFRPWFLEHLQDADRERRDRAALLAAGAPAAGTPADILAWLDAQPRTPAELALAAALDSAVDLLMEHPDDHAAIRAALARLAPYLVRCAGDPPLTILTALRAVFLGVPADLAT